MGNDVLRNREEEDESLSIEINIQKSCYYPGEKISGNIILQAKTSKVPLTFNFPNTIITLVQHQHYLFYYEDIQVQKDDKKPIFFRRHNFKKYKDRDILIPLKIPFSFKIPKNAYPTLIHDNSNFIKHYLTIKFPKIQKKKSIGIIIQNIKKFSVANKLFKSPAEKFKDKRISSMFKKSKIAFLLKTEKNSYAYNELIPYEIVLNFTESNINIKKIRVSLTRNIYIQSNDYIDVKPIIIMEYDLPKKLEENVYHLCGYFSFPPISDYFSVNPMNIYNFYSNRIIDNIDKTFNSIYLYPTCNSDFLSCNYFLNLEIYLNSLLSEKELLLLPIELYTPLDIEQNEKNEENEEDDNNIFKNEIEESNTNKNNFKLENIINDNNNDEDINNDFQIINKVDFYKVLSEDN